MLSVGHLAFSSDSRIGVIKVDRPRLMASDWNLSIQNTTKADDGMYECQVNTREKINYKLHLSVQGIPDRRCLEDLTSFIQKQKKLSRKILLIMKYWSR